MLNLRQKFALVVGVATGFLSIIGSCPGKALAVEPSRSLVATALQDELRRLPPDNTVLFAAASRSVALRLDALNQFDSSELAGTMVTVINSNGGSREYQADDSGVVNITDVEVGPHAIVANKRKAHGSMLLVFEEAGKDQNKPANAGEPAPQEVGKARMTLAKLDSNDLISIVDKYLPPSRDSSGPLLVSDMVAPSGYGPSAFELRITDAGELYGQIISLLRPGVSGADVRGTHVSLFNEGRQVGQTVCDESGRFMIPDVSSGPHGIVAAGSAGYAAFGFDVSIGTGVVNVTPSLKAKEGRQFVSTVAVQPNAVADVLPVVLIPPAIVPQVVETIRLYYPPMSTPDYGPELGGLSPMPGAGAMGLGGGVGPGSPAPGGGFGGPGGASGAGGGFGGGGGLGGLVGVAAVGAAVAASNNNNNNGSIIVAPTPVSPVSP